MIRDFNSVLNVIKLAQARKRLYVSVPIDRRDMPLLHLLHRVGVLRTFHMRVSLQSPKRWNAQLGLHYYRGAAFWRLSSFLTRRGRQISITYAALRLLQRRLGSSFLVLSTPNGLKTSFEALRNQEGGLVMFFVL